MTDMHVSSGPGHELQHICQRCFPRGIILCSYIPQVAKIHGTIGVAFGEHIDRITRQISDEIWCMNACPPQIQIWGCKDHLRLLAWGKISCVCVLNSIYITANKGTDGVASSKLGVSQKAATFLLSFQGSRS